MNYAGGMMALSDTNSSGSDRDSLRCAVVQFESRPDDKVYNLERVRTFVAAAVADRVQLVAFPEMCSIGYWHLRNHTADQLHALAESVSGPTVTSMSGLAVREGVGIGVGFLEAGDDGRLFNSYAVCLPDGQVHCHRKLHAFEHEAISSGDRYTVFDTPWGVRVGVLICWDNNLIENVRAVALDGVEILLAPHQTGGTQSRSPHGMKRIPLDVWEGRHQNPQAVVDAFQGPDGRGWLMRWLPSRAHDNGIFILFSNGVGRDDDEVRTGNAMILDPYGRILAESTSIGDDRVTADLDLGLLELSSGRRWMQGRRPELYAILTQRTGRERDARSARFSTEAVPRPSADQTG